MRIEELIHEGEIYKLDATDAFGIVRGIPDFLTSGSVHAIATHNIPVGYYVPARIMLELLREEAHRDGSASE